MADKDHEKKTDEQKAAEEFAASVPAPRSMVVPGNDVTGYIGVSPEYQNYAHPTNKPYLTEVEAHNFTGLTNEQVLATRDHKSDFDEERPAVAEDTGFDFKADQDRREKEEREAAEADKDEESEGDGEKKKDEIGPVVAGPSAPASPQRPPLG